MMIYVSGKITGDKNYKQKFEKAANKLISFGYDVFNPAILPNGLEYEQYMQIDFLPFPSVRESTFWMTGSRVAEQNENLKKQKDLD